MAPQRVLVRKPATIWVQFLDQDGRAADAAGEITVAIERLTGPAVVSPVVTPHSETAPGLYSFQLSATDLPGLDILSITLTDEVGAVETATVEVVGGYYFSIPDVRVADVTMRAIERFPDDDIVRLRSVVEYECERITQQSFVRRLSMARFSGSDLDDVVVLPHDRLRRIVSISEDGNVLTSDEVASATLDADGFISIKRSWPRGHANISFVYEHGWDSPPPDLQDAAIVHLRQLLLRDKTGIDDRQTALSNEAGSFTLATPGRAGFETGFPSVDAVYKRYRRQPIGIA